MRLIASVPVGSAVLQGHAGLGVVALRFHWEVKSTGHVARTFAVGGTLYIHNHIYCDYIHEIFRFVYYVYMFS